MNKHKHIPVKINDFLIYQEKYGHNRLDKWHRIQPYPNVKSSFLSNISGKIFEEEIFDGIETKYTIQKVGNNYLILFKTNKGNEYRFDLINEPNTKIYDLAFSISSNSLNNEEEYLKLTSEGESKEVFAKLVWILKDITPKIDVSEYCIGATGINTKDRIYQYMMKFVSGWERRDTNKYDLGWALYFKL